MILWGGKIKKRGRGRQLFFPNKMWKYRRCVCTYIPVRISCFHKLQQRSLQFFCTSAAWSMKCTCPNLITQPFLCPACTRLRITEISLFVVNKIEFSQTETKIIAVHYKIITVHYFKRRCSGNIRSQLYCGLPHFQCPGTLIKSSSFVTCAVDNSWPAWSLVKHPALQLFQHNCFKLC